MTPYVEIPPMPHGVEKVFTPHWSDCGQGYTEWLRDLAYPPHGGWRRYSRTSGNVYGPALTWERLIAESTRVWTKRPTAADIDQFYSDNEEK